MKPFHITCVMHNSRTSIRMFNYKIKNGIAEYLTIAEEGKLLEIICGHVKQYKLSLLSFNICGDHIHFVINEELLYLNRVIGRLKSISSREFNIWRGITVPIARDVDSSEETRAIKLIDGIISENKIQFL